MISSSPPRHLPRQLLSISKTPPSQTNPSNERPLHGRRGRDGLGDFGQPFDALLAVDLEHGLPGVAALERGRAHDVPVRAHDLLVVVDVGGAVAAEEAVHLVARVALVRVALDLVLALGDVELALVDDLVQGEGRARHGLARLTVAVSAPKALYVSIRVWIIFMVVGLKVMGLLVWWEEMMISWKTRVRTRGECVKHVKDDGNATKKQ